MKSVDVVRFTLGLLVSPFIVAVIVFVAVLLVVASPIIGLAYPFWSVRDGRKKDVAVQAMFGLTPGR